MMTRAELKNWSKNKIKGNIWKLLGVIIITSILTSITIGAQYTFDQATGEFTSKSGYNIGFIFYFVEVGLWAALVNFVSGQDFRFKDIFKYSSDFVRCLVTRLLGNIFTALWTLLFIVPGIIKAYAYSLIPLLLADPKYKDLSAKEILKKSEEMMDGHKMDFFVLSFSFVGWHILALFTLGLLELWIIPYQRVATAKFLNDIKTSNEGVSGPAPVNPEVAPVNPTADNVVPVQPTTPVVNPTMPVPPVGPAPVQPNVANPTMPGQPVGPAPVQPSAVNPTMPVPPVGPAPVQPTAPVVNPTNQNIGQ